MIQTFKIQGSGTDPYSTNFLHTDTTFSAQCTCLAGVKQQLCKHIISILEGEIPKGLIDGDTNQISSIAKAFQASETGATYKAYLQLNTEIELLKKDLANRKKQVARMLYK
nr:hypothetical protein [Lysinibacillus sphaericus]